jgi:hypothetical protein
MSANVNIYAEYREKAKYAFVPAERGRFIRTHICAAWIACPNCGAKKQRPCRSSDDNMTVATCLVRRQNYRKMVARENKRNLNSRGGRGR